MPDIKPFLWFNTEAEEAAKFYTSIFPNSRIVKIARYGEAGHEVHGRQAGSVMTVDFELDGQRVLALNAGPLFKEPAARMTQHEGWACSRVGWTIPAAHAKTNGLRIEHPIRTLTYRALVTHRSNRDLCLSCDNCLLE